MKIRGRGAVAGVCVFFAATCASAAELSKNEATKLLTFMGKENVVVAAAVGSSLAQDPFARLLAAAEGGDSASQLQVGVKYATGDGVRVNGSEAVRWLERAANANGKKIAVVAAGWLGVVHDRGMGVRKSGETAVRWYTRGAELGSGTSAQNLGELYLAGNLVKKNEKLGYEWYARAATLYEAEAATGDAKAAYQAARIYHRGVGVTPDPAKATALLETASAAGNADAAKLLNEIRARPMGVVPGPALGQEPSDLITVDSGCQFADPFFTQSPHKRVGVPQAAYLGSGPELKATTTVPCVDGKLEGSGRVDFFVRGTRHFEYIVQPSSGVAFKAGRIIATPDPSQIRYEPGNCTRSERWIKAVVPDAYALWSPALIDALAALGIAELDKNCSVGERGTGGVVMHWASSYSPMANPRAGKSIQRGPRGTSSSFDATFAWNDVSVRVERAVAAEAQRVQQLKAAETARSKAAEATRLSQQRRERRQQLMARHGAFEVISLETIVPNPFVWTGKQIGACTGFERMLSPSVAALSVMSGSFILSGVPTTRFRNQTGVFLVARVMGTANGTTELRYLEAVDQRGGCSEFVDP